MNYRCTAIKKDIGRPAEMTCKFFVYGYEYKHIVSAWCIDSFDISKEVTMYDDPMYNDWENRSIQEQNTVIVMWVRDNGNLQKKCLRNLLKMG